MEPGRGQGTWACVLEDQLGRRESLANRFLRMSSPHPTTYHLSPEDDPKTRGHAP